MATVEVLLNTAYRPGDLIQCTALARDGAGAPDNAAAVTFSIYAPSIGQYWNNTTLSWGGAFENPSTHNDGFDGIYRLQLDHADMDPAEGELRVVVRAATIAPVYGFGVANVRYDIQTIDLRESEVGTGPTLPVERGIDILKALKVVLTQSSQLNDDTKRQEHFAEDGTTVVMSFDLKDAAGGSSVREPYSKEIV